MRPSIVCVFVVATGLAVFAYGAHFGQFKTRGAVESLENQQWWDSLEVAMDKPPEQRQQGIDALADKWYAQRATLLTPRDSCEDLGAGLVLLGVTVCLLAAANRLRTFRDLNSIPLPQESRFWRLAVLTWLSFVPAEWCYYSYAQARGDFPPFADVLGIPFAGALAFGVLGLPVVLAGVWLVNHVRQLPRALWSRAVLGKVSAIELVIWAALLLALFVTAWGVAQEPPIVPSGVASVYLLLCGRRKVAQQYSSSHP